QRHRSETQHLYSRAADQGPEPWRQDLHLFRLRESDPGVGWPIVSPLWVPESGLPAREGSDAFPSTEMPRVHHAARRRGCRVAAGGACAGGLIGYGVNIVGL